MRQKLILCWAEENIYLPYILRLFNCINLRNHANTLEFAQSICSLITNLSGDAWYLLGLEFRKIYPNFFPGIHQQILKAISSRACDKSESYILSRIFKTLKISCSCSPFITKSKCRNFANTLTCCVIGTCRHVRGHGGLGLSPIKFWKLPTRLV